MINSTRQKKPLGEGVALAPPEVIIAGTRLHYAATVIARGFPPSVWCGFRSRAAAARGGCRVPDTATAASG